MKWVAIVTAAVVLAGCQTKPVSEMSYSEVQALATEITNRCIAQGAPPKSRNFKACSDQEITRELALRQKNRDSQLALAAGMQAMSNSYNRPRLNCVQNAVGSSVYTNCY